jgi:hypothetical protein
VQIASGSNFFMLVVPLLQPKVMGLYLIRGVGFPSYVPLEETGSYPDLLGCNLRPTILMVHDPDN